MADALHDVVFPPPAWMSDSAMERSMMYHAALRARGDVLIGGLGLAIYPQLVLEPPAGTDAKTRSKARARHFATRG